MEDVSYKRMHPKNYIYPSINCNIYYGKDGRFNLKRYFRSKKECFDTIEEIRDKVTELGDYVKYITIRAKNRGCPLYRNEYIEIEDIDQCLNDLKPIYAEEFEIFGE